MGRRGECWERHSRRQVPPHQPARRGFVRGVSLSVGDDAWTGRRRRQFVGRRRCRDGAAKASVHRGAEERRHGRDTRTAAMRAAQQASRVPQWSFMAADYQIDRSKPLVADLDSTNSRPVPSVIGGGGSPGFSAWACFLPATMRMDVTEESSIAAWASRCAARRHSSHERTKTICTATDIVGFSLATVIGHRLDSATGASWQSEH
jgi:hypothetical protein